MIGGWHDILVSVYGVVLGTLLGGRRKAKQQMYGVQIHDEWLEKDAEFLMDLERAMQNSYMRRTFEHKIKAKFQESI